MPHGPRRRGRHDSCHSAAGAAPIRQEIDKYQNWAGPSRAQCAAQSTRKRNIMKLFTDLVSTDYGLMSLAVIVITLVMGVVYVGMFVSKSAKKP